MGQAESNGNNNNTGAVSGGNASSGNSRPSSASTTTSSPSIKEEPILLNVYVPNPEEGKQQMNVPGFGVYHTGVQVYGVEYCFAGGDSTASGIMTQEPRYMPAGAPWVYKQTEKVGTTLLTRTQIQQLISKMGAEYPNNTYNLVARNCNHFSDDFCKRISKSKSGIPGWVNRTAGFANAFFGSGIAGGGGRAPASAPAPEPEPSVFSKPGYSLATGAVVDNSTPSKKKSDTKSGNNTSAAPAKRKNPWADPNFKPGGKTVKEFEASSAAIATTSPT